MHRTQEIQPPVPLYSGGRHQRHTFYEIVVQERRVRSHKVRRSPKSRIGILGVANKTFCDYFFFFQINCFPDSKSVLNERRNCSALFCSLNFIHPCLVHAEESAKQQAEKLNSFFF